MLKMQKPNKPNEYEKFDISRINELHLAGFFPEYLDGSYVYFRKSKELTEYLSGEKVVLVSDYIQSEIIEDTAQFDYDSVVNINTDEEPMIVDIQPEKKERKTKKMVIEKEVSEDE